MSSVTSKSLLLSQPKAGQSDSIPFITLPHDSYTEESSTIVKVEIPGVDPSTVDVSCDNNTLQVRCERGELILPIDPTIDTSKIKAEILWGLLTLTVPAPAAPVVKSIKVSIHDTIKSAKSKFTDAE